MAMRIISLCSLSAWLVSTSLLAQQRGGNPFEAENCALKIGRVESTARIADYVKRVMATSAPVDLSDLCATALASEANTERGKANWFLFIAELMKRVGDH